MKVYIGTVGSLQANKTLLPANSRKITENSKDIRRTTTLSSGKRVVDIIREGVKTFSFDYGVITDADLTTWLSFVGSGTWEIEIERKDTTYDKYSVRFSEETKFTYKKAIGSWWYENVTFVLEEI